MVWAYSTLADAQVDISQTFWSIIWMKILVWHFNTSAYSLLFILPSEYTNFASYISQAKVLRCIVDYCYTKVKIYNRKLRDIFVEASVNTVWVRVALIFGTWRAVLLYVLRVYFLTV